MLGVGRNDSTNNQKIKVRKNYNGNFNEFTTYVRWSRCVHVWNEADELWFRTKCRFRNKKSF
jgi:hypothetical protein